MQFVSTLLCATLAAAFPIEDVAKRASSPVPSQVYLRNFSSNARVNYDLVEKKNLTLGHSADALTALFAYNDTAGTLTDIKGKKLHIDEASGALDFTEEGTTGFSVSTGGVQLFYAPDNKGFYLCPGDYETTYLAAASEAPCDDAKSLQLSAVSF